MIFSINLKSIDSTQDFAHHLIENGFMKDKTDIIIIAQKQIYGRGQKDNKWSSNYGGLYFSYINHISEKNLNKVEKLSINVAEIIKDIIDKNYGVETIIKPPNDIYAKTKEGYKKISGILIETKIKNDKRYVVVGVGVNFSNKIPPELKDKAANLYEITGKRYKKNKFLIDFVKKIRVLFYELQNT